MHFGAAGEKDKVCVFFSQQPSALAALEMMTFAEVLSVKPSVNVWSDQVLEQRLRTEVSNADAGAKASGFFKVCMHALYS